MGHRPILYLQHAGQPDLGLTYDDVLRRASAFARALESGGIRPGEVVVVILQHGADLIAAFLGAILGGAVPAIMPFLTEKLLPERYRAELRSLVAVSRPAAIITYDAFRSEVERALTAESSVRSLLVAESVISEDSVWWTELGGQQRAAADVVVLQHSSGTTGLQKGVALSHQAVFNQLAAYGGAIEISPSDVIVSWLPLYHDMGLIAGFLMPLLTGVPLVLLSPFDWVRAPHRLMHAVTAYRGTLSWLPNFAFNFCAQKIRPGQLEGTDLSSWRAVINCSEPVRAESHEAFERAFEPWGLRRGALQTCYAMAENVFAVTQSSMGIAPKVVTVDRRSFADEGLVRPPDDAATATRVMSSGRALPNATLRVVDEKRRELSDRCVGELAIRSDCLLTEYFRRPDATSAALRDGWLLTGDLGFVSEGEVFVTGRKKDVIIVGGKNIYSQDIEALATEVRGTHPGRVVAFGVFSEEQGTEEVVVVAEAEAEGDVEKGKLADRIRRHVTQNSDVSLRHVEIVPPRWIIKTSSGKAARGATREKYLGTVGS